MNDQCGIQPSGGTIQKWIMQAAERLEPTYTAEPTSDHGSFDESSLRVNGTALAVRYSNLKPPSLQCA